MKRCTKGAVLRNELHNAPFLKYVEAKVRWLRTVVKNPYPFSIFLTGFKCESQVPLNFMAFPGGFHGCAHPHSPIH